MSSSKELLDMYKGLWEEKRGNGIKHTAEEWDKRAVEWMSDIVDTYVTRRRISEAVRVLEKFGILNKEADVIDIGCGPGHFVAEFAQRVHHAVGTDWSEQMLRYGEEYCRERGASNTSFVPCDFKAVSVEDMGWEKKFDLVFSSMTPAISTYACIEKMLEMSRGWCCNTTCVYETGDLQEDLREFLGGDIVHPAWEGNWFHYLNSIAFLMGYLPYTTYYDIEFNEDRRITPEGVENDLHRMCREKMPGPEKVRETYEMLMEKSDHGIYHDARHQWHGLILWDTREKTGRW